MSKKYKGFYLIEKKYLEYNHIAEIAFGLYEENSDNCIGESFIFWTDNSFKLDIWHSGFKIFDETREAIQMLADLAKDKSLFTPENVSNGLVKLGYKNDSNKWSKNGGSN